MNKKKTLRKPSLIERAIETQKELTWAMIGLSREVIRATDIREQARREYVSSRIKSSYESDVKVPLNKGPQVFDDERQNKIFKELEELKDWKRSANEETTRLREGVQHYKLRLEGAESREKKLIETIHNIKSKVEKKAKSKKSYRRLVDARNIMRIIEPTTKPGSRPGTSCSMI